MHSIERQAVFSGPAYAAAEELIAQTQARAATGASQTEIITTAMTGVRNAAICHFGGIKTITEMEVIASLMATHVIGLVASAKGADRPGTLGYAVTCGTLLAQLNDMASKALMSAPADIGGRMHTPPSGPNKDAS
jgi:hypothetical protein